MGHKIILKSYNISPHHLFLKNNAMMFLLVLLDARKTLYIWLQSEAPTFNDGNDIQVFFYYYYYLERQNTV